MKLLSLGALLAWVWVQIMPGMTTWWLASIHLSTLPLYFFPTYSTRFPRVTTTPSLRSLCSEPS